MACLMSAPENRKSYMLNNVPVIPMVSQCRHYIFFHKTEQITEKHNLKYKMYVLVWYVLVCIAVEKVKSCKNNNVLCSHVPCSRRQKVSDLVFVPVERSFPAGVLHPT